MPAPLTCACGTRIRRTNLFWIFIKLPRCPLPRPQKRTWHPLMVPCGWLGWGSGRFSQSQKWTSSAVSNPHRIARITLDERTVIRRSADIEHERRVAIYDLLEANSFQPVGDFSGPYHVLMGMEENRLALDIHDDGDALLTRILLPLTPFRRIIRDYFTICESYFQAIKTASPSRIEAIDMGRRGLHNEGSDLLRERLDGKVAVDNETARRLFTLICILQIRS